MSTSIVKLTNIYDSSHENGFVIFDHAKKWKDMKKIITLNMKKETKLYPPIETNNYDGCIKFMVSWWGRYDYFKNEQSQITDI